MNIYSNYTKKRNHQHPKMKSGCGWQKEQTKRDGMKQGDEHESNTQGSNRNRQSFRCQKDSQIHHR